MYNNIDTLIGLYNLNNSKKVPKKIYVDEDKYNRLKKVLGIMNISITDFLDSMFLDFLDSAEDFILSDEF